jgi:hypothetical protein
MATKAQIRANKENAQHSTGPTTDAGREAVSQNATKHGLTGRFIFYCDEDRQLHDVMLQRLEEDLNPVNTVERLLVDHMSQSLYRRQKAVDLQDDIVDQLAYETNPALIAQLTKQLELYMRYQTNHDRAYQRYAAELRKAQQEREKAKIGSVSQKRAEAEETRRQAAETRKAEDHKITMDIKKTRLEREQARSAAVKTSQTPLQHCPVTDVHAAGEQISAC